jgi:hypothetical protein
VVRQRDCEQGPSKSGEECSHVADDDGRFLSSGSGEPITMTHRLIAGTILRGKGIITKAASTLREDFDAAPASERGLQRLCDCLRGAWRVVVNDEVCQHRCLSEFESKPKQAGGRRRFCSAWAVSTSSSISLEGRLVLLGALPATAFWCFSAAKVSFPWRSVVVQLQACSCGVTRSSG